MSQQDVAETRRWADVGADLRRLDPKRYLMLLEMAERIVSIYEGPVLLPVDAPVILPPPVDDGGFH